MFLSTSGQEDPYFCLTQNIFIDIDLYILFCRKQTVLWFLTLFCWGNVFVEALKQKLTRNFSFISFVNDVSNSLLSPWQESLIFEYDDIIIKCLRPNLRMTSIMMTEKRKYMMMMIGAKQLKKWGRCVPMMGIVKKWGWHR